MSWVYNHSKNYKTVLQSEHTIPTTSTSEFQFLHSLDSTFYNVFLFFNLSEFQALSHFDFDLNFPDD